MDIDQVDPELRRFVRLVGKPIIPDTALKRWVSRVGTAVAPFPAHAGVAIANSKLGAARVRHYRPDVVRTEGALVWIHGGGYVGGAPRINDPLCSQASAALGMQVFSLGYRTAPAHPFPAALDDVATGWEWVQAQAASLGVDAQRIVIGGESAGGGLAAALVQRLHDGDGIRPVGQWLFMPMLDDRTAANADLDALEHFVWNNAANRFGWRSYLAAEPGGEVPQYAAPGRRDDLRGLPPTFIAWSDIELFADEDAAYAARLVEAGVPVTSVVVAAAPHGFGTWARRTAIAQDLITRAIAWLGAELRVDSATM